MSNTEAPNAAVYVQPDIADGEYSIEQLQKRNTAQQEAASAAAKATWQESPSLTAGQIKTLDGVAGGNFERKWETYNRDGIGQPKSIAQKQPAGYSSGEPDQTFRGDSEPRSLKPVGAAKKSIADARDSNVKGA